MFVAMSSELSARSEKLRLAHVEANPTEERTILLFFRLVHLNLQF